MGLKDYQRKILQQYEAQERLLASLYSEFGRQFPEERDFWERLVREETAHARLVEKLHGAVDKDVMIFDEGKVKTYTLSAMIQRIESLLQRARQGDIDRRKALALAMDLEEALIEKEVFTHFEPLTDKARAVLKRLQAETRDHVERVRRMRARMARSPEPKPTPRTEEVREPRVQWASSLSTGIEEIDTQHRFFFELINRASALQGEEGQWEKITELIGEMLRYSDAHFKKEDDLMIESEFPLFGSHRREHQRYMEKLSNFAAGLRGSEHRKLIGEIIDFLANWWLLHIQESDMRYVRWIRKKSAGEV